jgi:hypothetical protein
MKRILGVHSAPQGHWVGDGFPVRTLFFYNDLGRELSPFLMLDYAGPAKVAPAARPRGVGQHPHRGFETVTIVYQGEVEHRDSTGNGGKIGPGDVQWMTAGAGILHDEFHSAQMTREGGTLEMVQLWVNLPAKDKMTQPGYQAIVNSDIPQLDLDDGAGSVRVIAGDYSTHRGPARTFTAMNVWDLRIGAGKTAKLDLPQGHTCAIVVLKGEVTVNVEAKVGEAQMAVLGREGEGIHLTAGPDAIVLLLSGEPIDEPIVGYGPFVMNTQQEIVQAVNDFNSGGFGRMPA